MGSDDVVIACVAENRAEWYRMIENLAITTRNFGGRLAGARLAAHVVDGVDISETRVLEGLGVELYGTVRYPAAEPTTNKLRMFEDFVARGASGLLVALDCDVVVVADFLDEAELGTLCAMAAGSSPMTGDEWSRFLESLGLPEADRPTVMLETGQEVPAPYLNSGVMLVPGSIAPRLTSAWVRYVDRFAAELEAGVDQPWNRYWIDQVALTCALLEERVPVRELGPHMNLPTAITFGDRIDEVDLSRLSVLHYHRHISHDGLLLPSDSPRLNDVIGRVNDVVSARSGRGGGVRRGRGRTSGRRSRRVR